VSAGERDRSGPGPNLWAASAIAVLAMVASLATLRNGYTFDDWTIIVGDDRIHTLARWRDLLASSYWPARLGASHYRPLTTLLFALQWTIGGGAPWVLHLTSVVLYAASAVAVHALARRLLSAPVAWATAALFAVHPVHVEAVASIVGQAELTVALVTVLAVTIYLDARAPATQAAGGASAGLPASRIAAIAALFAAGCLAKEHAIVLPGLLASAELLLVRDERPWRVRLRAIAPLYGALATLAGAYVALRAAVVGSTFGEQALVPMAPMTRVYTMFGAAPTWARLLLWPAHLSADYGPPGFAILHAFDVTVLPGIVLVAGALTLVVALGRRHAVGAWALLWTAIAILPVSNLLVGLTLFERTMFLPSVGVVIAIGAAVAAVGGRLRRPGAPAWMTRAAPLAAWAILGVTMMLGAARSIARDGVWHDNLTLFAQTVRDAPLSYRAHYLYGISLFEAGDRRRGEHELLAAIRLDTNANDADPFNYLATQYRMAGLCVQALPLYRHAIDRDGARPDARYGLAECLLHTGRIVEARSEARAGLARGQLRSLFLDVIARADSVARQGGAVAPAAASDGAPPPDQRRASPANTRSMTRR
jgi:protein O-mannosyl-transferase